MTTPELSPSGWHITQSGRPAERFQVFGERSSGTNFVRRLIARNSALEPTDDLGWKHGFPQMPAIPSDTAIVGVVRRADEWALAMHYRPWHTPPVMQKMPFSKFIRAEWATIVDRARYFPHLVDEGGIGEPLQYDRHPLTGRTFTNLFKLRSAKLQGLLGFAARGCPFILVRIEAVQAAPEEFMQAILPALGQPPLEEPLQPVVSSLGSKFKPSVRSRPLTPEALSPDDLAFLKSQIDPELEARLGYDY